MTTLAELKTQAAATLHDPDAKTFSDADLGYFINSAIAEVSRTAPQKFREDVQLATGTLDYTVRGGAGNLLANPSFESGDETMFDGAYNLVDIGETELTAGWDVANDDTRLLWTRSYYAKTGIYVGGIQVPAGVTSRQMQQDIPVNPGSTYYAKGWHWKSPAGGNSNIIRFSTLDADSVVVTTDAVRHATTASFPQFMSGSISVPDDDTVAFIRVILLAYQPSAAATEQRHYFEDISLSEENTNLVATNSLDAIEVRRVEVWSSSYDPPQKVGRIEFAQNDSESGWTWWDGQLHIPYRHVARYDPATAFLRVWGYAPYDKLTLATQVTDLSFELEQAVMEYVRVQGLEQLNVERDLFTQWQTRSGNSDISPAGLMSALVQAREKWRRTKRDILVLREGS